MLSAYIENLRTLESCGWVNLCHTVSTARSSVPLIVLDIGTWVRLVQWNVTMEIERGGSVVLLLTSSTVQEKQKQPLCVAFPFTF